MGYACPVCEVPQRDAEHLAHHLAFTAMLHDDAHRTWLDDNAPGWADQGPAALGARVAPLAPAATVEEVFEDTAHDHEAGRPFADREGVDGSAETAGTAGAVGPGSTGRRGRADALDETTRAVLAAAREMTRRRRGAAAEADDDEGTADADRESDEKA